MAPKKKKERIIPPNYARQAQLEQEAKERNEAEFAKLSRLDNSGFGNKRIPMSRESERYQSPEYVRKYYRDLRGPSPEDAVGAALPAFTSRLGGVKQAASSSSSMGGTTTGAVARNLSTKEGQIAALNPNFKEEGAAQKAEYDAVLERANAVIGEKRAGEKRARQKSKEEEEEDAEEGTAAQEAEEERQYAQSKRAGKRVMTRWIDDSD
ncbi:hypothetical protein E4T43_01977 [Aureobasidium subglaciale]|nr:hypothetical protein E4T43_01977 [Aureobasidium subglaciale]